jgi:hypothetical protein
MQCDHDRTIDVRYGGVRSAERVCAATGDDHSAGKYGFGHIGWLPSFKEGHHDDYVLMGRPSVRDQCAEATCVAAGITVGLGQATHQFDQSMVGRWVENLRKLEGREGHREASDSFRLVPVVIPRAAEAAPPPSIEPPAAPQAEAAPPQVAGTTGIAEEPKLPKTASPLPLAGSIGLLSIAGALALRMFRRRRVEG